MSLFQSALDFLAGPGTLGAASRDQNDFVGQTVEMGEMKLRIRRVIAEGKSGTRWRRPGGAALRCGRPSRGPLSPAAGPASGGRCSAEAGWGGSCRCLRFLVSLSSQRGPWERLVMGLELKQDLSWKGRTGISTVDSRLYTEPPKILLYV